MLPKAILNKPNVKLLIQYFVAFSNNKGAKFVVTFFVTPCSPQSADYWDLESQTLSNQKHPSNPIVHSPINTDWHVYKRTDACGLSMQPRRCKESMQS